MSHANNLPVEHVVSVRPRPRHWRHGRHQPLAPVAADARWRPQVLRRGLRTGAASRRPEPARRGFASIARKVVEEDQVTDATVLRLCGFPGLGCAAAPTAARRHQVSQRAHPYRGAGVPERVRRGRRWHLAPGSRRGRAFAQDGSADEHPRARLPCELAAGFGGGRDGRAGRSRQRAGGAPGAGTPGCDPGCRRTITIPYQRTIRTTCRSWIRRLISSRRC